MNYFQYFKETWIPVYIKQIRKNNDYETKNAIKNNIYKNINLTTQEKDKVWNEITRRIN